MTDTVKDNKKVRYAANPPIVHAELAELGEGETTIRVRVIQYQHPKIGVSEPMLDIREHYNNKKNPDGTYYTGWSRGGVSLKLNELEDLHSAIERAMEIIAKMEDK